MNAPSRRCSPFSVRPFVATLLSLALVSGCGSPGNSGGGGIYAPVDGDVAAGDGTTTPGGLVEVVTVEFTAQLESSGGADPMSPRNYWAEGVVTQDGVIKVSASSGEMPEVVVYLVDFDDGSVMAGGDIDTTAGAEAEVAKGDRFYIVAGGGAEGAAGAIDVRAELAMGSPGPPDAFMLTQEFASGSFDECLMEHKECLSGVPLDACWPNPCRAGEAYPFKGWYDLTWGPITCSRDPDTVYNGEASMIVTNDIVTVSGFASDHPQGSVDEAGVLRFEPGENLAPRVIEGTIDSDGYVSGTYPANCIENGEVYEEATVPFEGWQQETP